MLLAFMESTDVPVHSYAVLMPLLNMHQSKFYAVLCHGGRREALTTPTSMMHKPSKYLPGPAQTQPEGFLELQEVQQTFRPPHCEDICWKLGGLPSSHLEVLQPATFFPCLPYYRGQR